MEEVSSAPHRVQERDGLDDLSGDYSSDRNSMTYPQFVESLSLLATYAAERLRRFYPDIAGTNICKRSRGALKESGESSSRAHAGVGRSGLSAGGKDPQRVPGVGSSGKETRGLPGDLARSKTMRTLPVVQRQGAKRDAPVATATPPGGAASRKKPPVPSAVANAKQRLPYDLGALKALFHHARISYKENSSAVRIRSRGELARSGVSPRGKAEKKNSRPGKCGVGKYSKEGASGACTARGTLSIGGHESELVSDPTGRPTKVCVPAGPAHALNSIASRVASLETENFPSGFNSLETEPAVVDREKSEKIRRMGQARTSQEQHDKPFPPAEEVAGGAFARLVVVKELQLVPEHAPTNIRHLLELALDHHQAGRYDLALEIIDKAGNTWKTLQAGERSSPFAVEHDRERVLFDGGGTYHATGTVGFDSQVRDDLRGNVKVRSRGENVHGRVEQLEKLGSRGSRWGLDGADEALLRSMEASVCQSAGRDDDALSALLGADKAVATINQCGGSVLREAVTAFVLSEMGVVLYYGRQTALSLRCFRIALFLRNKVLQQQSSSEHDTPGAENFSEAEKNAPETEKSIPGRVADGGNKPAPPTRGSAVLPPAEAGEIAAAATLNNIGVCLAVKGDKSLAAKALLGSSNATTSALGIEHPRSVVISRNLALVKAAGGCSKSVVRDCRHGVTATSEPLASRWVGLDNVVFDRRWAVEFQH